MKRLREILKMIMHSKLFFIDNLYIQHPNLTLDNQYFLTFRIQKVRKTTPQNYNLMR